MDRSLALNGLVTGYNSEAPTNLPLEGVHVQVFLRNHCTGQKGESIRDTVTCCDGVWGPVQVRPGFGLEFRLSHPDHGSVVYIHEPIKRSFDHFSLRMFPEGEFDGSTLPESTGGGVLVLSRVRGYLAIGRDDVYVCGWEPNDIPSGVPTILSTMLNWDRVKGLVTAGNSLDLCLNGSRIVVESADVQSSPLTIAEFCD